MLAENRWATNRHRLAMMWGIISVWFLVLTIFSAIEITTDPEWYQTTLAKISHLHLMDEHRSVRVTQVICLGVMCGLALLCCIATGTDCLGSFWNSASKSSLHEISCVVLLYLITVLPLLAFGHVDIYFFEGIAFTLSCFSLLLQLQFGSTLVWVIGVSIGAVSLWARACRRMSSVRGGGLGLNGKLARTGDVDAGQHVDSSGSGRARVRRSRVPRSPLHLDRCEGVKAGDCVWVAGCFNEGWPR